MSGRGWDDFKHAAIAIAEQRGAIVEDCGSVVAFLHPRADERVEIRWFDTDAVMMRAGWFLTHAVDFEPDHMRDVALADLTALFDGGAVEFVAVRRDEVQPAGYELTHSRGGSSSRPPRLRGRRYKHTLPSWASLWPRP